ncbi:MAG: hypothetical protein WCW33_06675 [Candidatus Babeliales bacterium]|jgi:hypothetical protein
MAGIPSLKNLQSRQGVAEKRIQELKTTYADFLRAWSSIRRDEIEHLKKLHHVTDTKSLYDVLKTIDETSNQ